MSRWGLFVAGLLLAGAGFAAQKESHTARTGIEQLLVSSAVDRSLDQIDLAPVRQRRVFLDTKYLDCVDKNYIIVFAPPTACYGAGGTLLVDKPGASSEVPSWRWPPAASAPTVRNCSSASGDPAAAALADRHPATMSLFTRKRMNGTAKILVVAYDSKSRTPLVQSGTALARSDHNKWNVLATGTITTGSVPQQIAAATGEFDFNVMSATEAARKAFTPAAAPEVQQAGHKDAAATPPGEQVG